MNASSRPMVSVVIHDVAPSTWDACQRVMEAVHQVADVPMTLLVVPRYHLRPSEAAFEHAMSTLHWQGHELALHGYSHLDEGTPTDWRDQIKRHWYTDGEGEFSALCESAALLKLLAGARWFRRHQWALHGFVAPAWLLSEGSWQALRRLPLSYTTTLRAVYALPEAQPVASDCLVYSTRSLWRRALSVPRNALIAARWGQQALVRLELHPRDADFPVICRAWRNTLARLLDHREPLTLAQAMARLRQPGQGRVIADSAPAPGHEPLASPSSPRVVVPFGRP